MPIWRELSRASCAAAISGPPIESSLTRFVNDRWHGWLWAVSGPQAPRETWTPLVETDHGECCVLICNFCSICFDLQVSCRLAGSQLIKHCSTSPYLSSESQNKQCWLGLERGRETAEDHVCVNAGGGRHCHVLDVIFDSVFISACTSPNITVQAQRHNTIPGSSAVFRPSYHGVSVLQAGRPQIKLVSLVQQGM